MESVPPSIIYQYMVLLAVIETAILSYQDSVMPLNYKSENVRSARVRLIFYGRVFITKDTQHTIYDIR